jgi:uncharacterized protein YndB with AHSA1/START domain
MRWILWIFAVLMTIGLVVAIVGSMLPRDHVATASARIAGAPREVWSAISEPKDFPSWRTDVKQVEMLPATPSGIAWREHSGDGTISYVVDRSEAPTRLVTRISDQNLPFGGTWEYQLEPDGTGTKVTITERGSVYNPIFRFVSRFVMGHTATMRSYLRALGRKFGDDALVISAQHPVTGVGPAEASHGI